MKAKALIICDAACVHSASMFDKIRARFEVESNSILIHGGSAQHVPIPGGWGACGAPNDAWHQYFHYLRRGFMRASIGMSPSVKLRTAMQNVDLAIDGSTRIAILKFERIQHQF